MPIIAGADETIYIKKKESYLLFLIRAVVIVLSHFKKKRFSYFFMQKKEIVKICQKDSVPIVFNYIHNSLKKCRKELLENGKTEIPFYYKKDLSKKLIVVLYDNDKTLSKVADLTLFKPFGDWNVLSKEFSKHLFLNERDEKNFKNAFEKLAEFHEVIRKNPDNFPSSDDIFNYLRRYIKLCEHLFSCNYIIAQNGNRPCHFIEKIMNFGLYDEAEFKTTSSRISTSIYNPISLESLRRIYDYIYYRLFVGEYTEIDCNEFAEAPMIESFVVKISRDFRRYTTIDTEKFVISFNNIDDELFAIDFREVGSFEYIRPIRLFDKIVSYIDDYNIKNYSTIKIGIIGYVYKDLRLGFLEVDELLNFYYNSELYTKKHIELKLTIGVPSMGKRKKDSPSLSIDSVLINEIKSVKYEISYKDYFLSKSDLERFIKKNHLMFILDTPELYTDDFSVLTQYPLREFAGAISEELESYENASDEIGNEINKPNIMRRISSQLFVLATAPKYGYCIWGRCFKTYLYDYINSRISNSKKKTCFLYISSDFSLRNAAFVKNCAVRREKYNSKEINIVKIDSKMLDQQSEKPNLRFLPGDSVCFTLTLWSLIKNISITLKDDLYRNILGLLEECNKNIDEKSNALKAIILLYSVKVSLVFDFKSVDDMKLKIEWSYNKDDIETIIKSLNLDDKQNDIVYNKMTQFISKFLTYVFTIVFKDTEESLYVCLKNSVCNALYGLISSYEHSLIYSLIYNEMLNLSFDLSHVENIENMQMQDPEMNAAGVLKSIPIYHNKRPLVDCEVKLGRSIIRPSVRESLYSICSQNNTRLEDVYYDIRKICEMYQYTDSILYRNVTRDN